MLDVDLFFLFLFEAFYMIDTDENAAGRLTDWKKDRLTNSGVGVFSAIVENSMKQ